MLIRKINRQLDDFVKNSSKALLVDGARQVGKTYSIREFGKRYFSQTVEINFVQSKGAASIFQNTESAEEILMRLSTFTRKKLRKDDTLIFLDEVQMCPEAVTAIKFLVQEGSYRYVLSGSLLGVELESLDSVPVGYMDILTMHPLDFEEFIINIGVGENVIAYVKKAWQDKKPIDSVIHDRLIGLFRLYLLTGGMPDPVQRYVETNDMRIVKQTQDAILRTYRKDITQYDPRNKFNIEDVFDLIPSELNSQNKRFILKSLNEHARFERYSQGLLWLQRSGVAIPVFNTDEPKIPLLLSKERSLFKLFQNDIGLLASQYADDNDIRLKILSGDDKVNFGAIYENAVAQELTAHGFTPYYFSSKKAGELDFIVEHNGKVLPIEVKSGKDYYRHRALANILDIKNYDLSDPVVFSNDNLSTDGRITYAPIYMSMFLEKAADDQPMTVRPNLDGLDKDTFS